MNQRNFLPINITRVLEAIANVIHAPHMNDKNSVILLNHGLHFITSTNFSTYRVVIDRIVDLFKGTKKNDQGEKELKFKGKMIWKTNAAIHRERLRLPHHHKRRFLTRQVLLTFVHHLKIGTVRAFHWLNQKEVRRWEKQNYLACHQWNYNWISLRMRIVRGRISFLTALAVFFQLFIRRYKPQLYILSTDCFSVLSVLKLILRKKRNKQTNKKLTQKQNKTIVTLAFKTTKKYMKNQ